MTTGYGDYTDRIVLGRYPNFYATRSLADLNEEVRFRVEINDQVFSFNKHHGCEHEEPLFMGRLKNKIAIDISHWWLKPF
ncbi:hypothetical protein HMI54_013725 [Coelomomyces lativittatus]|nr:hypothetical protein HMI54_013725 [Coelomomyces lativittatus]